MDTALATRDSAAATVERTRAIIAQKALRAPFDGRIGLRNADLGQFAAVGTTLATLQKLDPIYADFPVPEEALATIAAGQDVTMTVAAIPGHTFNGKVKAIDARVSAESRNVTIRAQFDNPHRNLLPGMFANITVTTGAPADVLTVPRTAIVYSLYGDNVFVVVPAPSPEPGKAAAAAPPAGGGLVVERRFVRIGSDARRADRGRGRPQGGRPGRHRRTDQIAGEFAGHHRRAVRRFRPPPRRPGRDRHPMNAFTDLFIRRPVLASVVSLLILLVGLMAGFKLQIRQFPETPNTTITITTTYPGAAADVIKGFITTPIEQAVASAEGIDTLVSTSQQNVSTITLNLRLDANPDRAMADTLSKVNQVRGLLPREANDPVIVKQTGQGFALMYMSFNSKVMTASQITDYLTRVVQPRLQTVDGVANAQILGGQVFAMRIWLDPVRMAALGRDAERRARRARGQQFHQRRGRGEERLHPDQRQCADLARQPEDLRPAGDRRARRRAGEARRRLAEDRAWAADLGHFVGVRRTEGRVHRHLRHARSQSADGHRRRQGADPEHPGAAAAGPQCDRRLRFDAVHPRFDPRGRQDPRSRRRRSSSSSSSCSSAICARPSSRSSPFRCR